jgi:hypothetical protein
VGTEDRLGKVPIATSMAYTNLIRQLDLEGLELNVPISADWRIPFEFADRTEVVAGWLYRPHHVAHNRSITANRISDRTGFCQTALATVLHLGLQQAREFLMSDYSGFKARSLADHLVNISGRCTGLNPIVVEQSIWGWFRTHLPFAVVEA